MKREWTKLRQRLLSGEIDRRTFLAGASALGISSTLVGEAFAQTPKRGGHLIIGMPAASTKDSLDPAVYRADYMLAVGVQIYDSLAIFNERIQVQPFLAESWEAKSGAKEWVIKLRKGVVFHNGKEMTAADVVHSLNHHRSKESRSSVKVFASAMADVRATDKYEVGITLEGPNVDFPYILTLLQLVILPEGTSGGIGTGPYKIESFEPGVRTRAKRNENDWRKDRGYVASIETIAINDSTARLNALLSGAVHLVERISPSAAAAVEKNPQIQLFTIPSFGHNSFDMMIDTPPFNNLELRQALKYAIDRETILKVQLRGYGRLGNDQPIPPLDPFYAADIPQRLYDPDKAKFLAKKAGFSDTITLSAADAAFVGAVDMAQIFQSGAGKAGINLRVNRVPDDGYWQNTWMKQPFVASFWGGRPTPNLMFTHAYSSKSASNVTRWHNAKFDQLLLAARAEFDVAKRKQIYHDMQFMLHEEGGTIIPVFASYLDAGHKSVKGFVPFPFWEMSGFRAFEKVWLDA